MSEQRVLTGPGLDRALLRGRYEVRSLIGLGGMAEVYEAVDTLLGRRVAVKVLRKGLASDPQFLSRFRREARVAASLSHPNVVAVHDFGTHGDRPFIVMELLAGRTLAELIRHQAPFSPRRAAKMARQVADALAHAHARGIVHRDVAPGNVMVTPSGDVKVLDFGIARVELWTQEGGSPTAHGTLPYLSPEHARGEPADERSDVYALGAVLYEMLTGRPPFCGATAAAVADRHAQEAPVSARARSPAVSRALDEVVMRCLAKNPDERYELAWDLALDLAWAAGNSPPGPEMAALQLADGQAAELQTRRLTPALARPPRGRRLRRRHPWTWWAGVGATLAAGAMALASIIGPR